MASPPPDPYKTLGVTPTATDEEIRTAYRRLAQLHHPDHNNGSRDSALRFAEVQEAYAHVKLMRRQASAAAGAGAAAGRGATAGATAGHGATAGAGAAPGHSAPSGTDPALEARLAAMEQELQAARAQRERAARAAAEEAARAAQEADRQRTRAHGNPPPKPEADRASDEELGYYSTDDSFTKILDDFADQVASRFAEAHPPQRDEDAAKRPRGRGASRSLADWIDELGSRLSGEPTRESRDRGSRDEE